MAVYTKISNKDIRLINSNLILMKLKAFKVLRKGLKTLITY